MPDSLSRNKHSRGNDERWFAQKMVSPTVLVLLFMSAFSIAFTIYYSFTNYYYISKAPLKFVGFKNYLTLFKDGYFMGALWNTVRFTVWCTVLETAFGVLIAVFVNSLKRCRNLVRTLILIPYLLPPVTAALIWQVMLSSNYGIINQLMRAVNLETFNWFFDVRTAMPVIIAIDIWQCTPFCFLLLYASLQSIPVEQYEAAKIDGAGKIQEFFHITIPSLQGTIVLCLLLRTIDSFRMFDKINILTAGGPANTTATITQYIFTYGVKSLKFGFASAGAIVMAVLVLILSSFYIKRSVKG